MLQVIVFQSAITFLNISKAHLVQILYLVVMAWLKDLYIDRCGERKTLQFPVGTTTLIQDIISLLIRFALAFRY